MSDHHRDLADAITRLVWDNFLKTEPAMVLRDLIAVELEKAEERGREAAFQEIREGEAAS